MIIAIRGVEQHAETDATRNDETLINKRVDIRGRKSAGEIYAVPGAAKLRRSKGARELSESSANAAESFRCACSENMR